MKFIIKYCNKICLKHGVFHNLSSKIQLYTEDYEILETTGCPRKNWDKMREKNFQKNIF